MELSEQSSSDSFISAFARQRHQVARQAHRLLVPDSDVSILDRENAIQKLSALLVSSLEALKVAEEQMREQHAEIDHVSAEGERKVRFYRQLFELAPCAMLLTDLAGGIRECNRATATLLKQTPEILDRKPVSGLVLRTERQAFRECLSRLSITVGVTNWHFTIERPTDVPIPVVAAVHMVPDGGGVPGGLLWAIRPTLSADSN